LAGLHAVTETSRTVLLTGASGFVGRPALAALLSQGFRVHAVSRHVPAEIPAGVEWHSADLLDTKERRQLIEAIRPSHLLHLAWYVEHGKFWTAPENEIWVAASLDLLNLFAEAGGRRALFTGSCAEYDWSLGGSKPLSETDPCRPATPYGRAKLALMEQALVLASRRKVSFAWARFFLMFGRDENPRRLIPAIIRSVLRKEEVALSSGRQIRDFLDASDIGLGLAALLHADTVSGAVNLASGCAVTLREVGRMLANLAGQPEALLKFGALPDRDGEPASLVADVSRLTRDVGFAPAHTLEERLGQCLAWHRESLRLA
jgi:nucleoside-diphosphate-sugar epimerase